MLKPIRDGLTREKFLQPVDLKAPSYDRLPDQSHLISEINKDLLDELYQGDIRLTVEQADYLLKQAKMGRTKRQAFRDGNYPNTIWSSGVPYTIDTVFSKCKKIQKKISKQQIFEWKLFAVFYHFYC